MLMLTLSPDPSMTVRADITGRYANRMYAYEPNDAKLRKCFLKACVTSSLGLTECLPTEYSILSEGIAYLFLWDSF